MTNQDVGEIVADLEKLQRPRDRFLRGGLDGFNDYEIFVDHLIVSPEEAFSFRKAGLL